MANLTFVLTERTLPQEVFSLGEDIDFTAGTSYTQELTDSVIVTSFILRLPTKLFLSTINTTSLITKGITRLYSDLISMIDDTITTFKAMGLTLLDSIIVTDVYSRVIAFVRTLTDTVNTSEVFAKIKQLIRAFTDSIAVIDSLSKGRLLSLLDSIRVAESYIMRLNGIVIHWYLIARSAVGTWTNKVRSLVSWTNKTRSTSSWTDKERAE